MKLIRPSIINDATLTYSTVEEEGPGAYNGATTYAEFDRVSVATGTVLTVYTSLQNGNTGHAPASSPTWWKVTGTTYATYNAGVTYGLGDIVIVPTTHRRYESVQASNVNHAVTDPAWWLDLGVTNRWQMFDTSVSTQTANPDAIRVGITTMGRADSVALLNVSGATARITMTDAFEGQIYDKEYPLISDSGIQDWYAYFFEPIERISDLVITDMPPYADALVEIRIIEEGQIVLCGVCVVGLSKEIGLTSMGANIGIQDYSVKQQDGFGDFTVVERAFSKRANFQVLVDGAFVDPLLRLLAAYRAAPIVYVDDAGYASTVVFGFYKDFQIEIAYPDYSLCTLEIEGLT